MCFIEIYLARYNCIISVQHHYNNICRCTVKSLALNFLVLISNPARNVAVRACLDLFQLPPLSDDQPSVKHDEQRSATHDLNQLPYEEIQFREEVRHVRSAIHLSVTHSVHVRA